MFARLRTAAKFFTVGLIVGLIFAPDSGENIRRRIVDRLTTMIPGVSSGE